MSFALLCPGQGAQHPGMLNIAEHHAVSAEVLRAATAALGEDLHAWLADPVLLFENARAQPLVCISQLAWWAALREQLPSPIAFAGYSVGELAAYGVANALDTAALASLARDRARLMDAAASAEPGGVIALRGLSRAAAAEMCAGKRAFIAIVIDEDAYVIGGTQSALDAVTETAWRASAQVTCLRVGVASHTPLLAAAAARFRTALEASPLSAPARPVVAGIDSSWVVTRERAIGALSEQIARTIEWSRASMHCTSAAVGYSWSLAPGQRFPEWCGSACTAWKRDRSTSFAPLPRLPRGLREASLARRCARDAIAKSVSSRCRP